MKPETVDWMNAFKNFNYPDIEEKWIGWIADKRAPRWVIVLHHKAGTIEASHPDSIEKAIEKFFIRVAG